MKSFESQTHDLQLIRLTPEDYKDFLVLETGQSLAGLFPNQLLILMCRQFHYIEDISTGLTVKMQRAGFNADIIGA